MDIEQHKTIWLQPWCEGCQKHSYGSDGRQWCEDDPWGHCDECGRAAVKYVLAPDQPTPLVDDDTHSLTDQCD